MKKGSSLILVFPSLKFGEDSEKELVPLDFEGDGFSISQILNLFLTDLLVCNCNCEALNKLQYHAPISSSESSG